MTRELTGWHVLMIFCGCFAVIIGVNLTLAWNAIATFPGLEVKNSYVASQSFDRDRAAQEGLNWDVAVTLDSQVSGQVSGQTLRLDVQAQDGAAIHPVITEATVGRPTEVSDDRTADFAWDGTGFVAPVDLAPGHWVLRLKLLAADGTAFKRNFAMRVSDGNRP